MNFRLLLPAKLELQETAQFGKPASLGLGFEFLAEVRAMIRRILTHPQAWHPLEEGICRCRTNRFHYGIIYSVEKDEVIIISVLHLHRHTDSWRKNLR